MIMNHKAYKSVLRSVLRHLAVIFCLVSLSLTATAYEQDTHLRMTYLIARSVGINDETSKFLAYGNQHIDQTAVTSAMLLPPQRALFHFTGSFHNLQSSAHGGAGIFSTLRQMFWTQKISIAERNHAVGSMLIYQGLVDGDLQKVSAGLHVKMDTYGHAGFTNAWGHMFDGHNPDRVFLETEKYQDMVRSITQSMVAVREALPESALDKAGALQFLNKYVHETAQIKKLVEADLDSAIKISSILTSSSELKKVYAENTFNNFSFKKMALKIIFDDFKLRGIFNTDITFNEIFPKDILELRKMNTADTIVAVLMQDAKSEFLENSNGKSIFNQEKLVTQILKGSSLNLKEKLQLETDRFAQRIRDFEKRRLRLKNPKPQFLDKISHELEAEAVEKEYKDLSIGLNIENINEDIEVLMNQISVKEHQNILNKEKEITAKYETLASPLLKDLNVATIFTGSSFEAVQTIKKYMEQMNSEIAEMKRAMFLENFIAIRSRQLAQHKFATDIANTLTKDFIPQKYTQYFKQLFEKETYTRVFEKHYKDEAWRRFLYQSFGVNWINAKDDGVLENFTGLRVQFKKMMSRRNMVMIVRTNRVLLAEAKSAAKVLIPGDIPDRDQAQKISFNTLGTISYAWKMLKYVGLGFIPYFGEKYLQRIYEVAHREAKHHEVEDIRSKIEQGKYKKIDVLGNTQKQLKQMSSSVSCKYLFN
jgi:hypothetical protein